MSSRLLFTHTSYAGRVLEAVDISAAPNGASDGTSDARPPPFVKPKHYMDDEQHGQSRPSAVVDLATKATTSSKPATLNERTDVVSSSPRSWIRPQVPPPGVPVPSPPRSPDNSPASLLSHLLTCAAYSPQSTLQSKTHVIANILSALEIYVETYARFPMVARYRPRLYQAELAVTGVDDKVLFAEPVPISSGRIASHDDGNDAAAAPSHEFPPSLETRREERERTLTTYSIPVIVLATAGYDENECELYFSTRCRRTGKRGVCGARDLLAWETSAWNRDVVRTVRALCDEAASESEEMACQ